MTSNYDSEAASVKTALDATYAAKNHTHSGYASSTHDHGNLSNIGQLTASPSTVGGVVVTDNKSDKICVTSQLPYSKISGTPTIPSKISDLTNDSDFIETSSTDGLIKNDGTIMTSGTGASNWAVGNHTHSAYVSATKVTSWQSTPSDSNVPSEKLVKDYVDGLIGSAISYIVGSGN